LNLGEQIGSLTVGKKADLVMYDLTSLSLLPRTDPVGLLVLGRPTNVVDSVWVNGELIVANGKVKNIDVDSLRQELFKHSQWQTKRKSKTVKEIEAHYRGVMEL
jgi:cytosine/adenosine deaminase-related metal-dependent hydrolase